MRIGGLASGMDIDSLVSELMKVERIPLDKIKQKKQTMEWQRDSYREMNTLLKELDTFIFDGVSLQSNLTKKSVTSSNELSVTASANASASNISTNIEVKALAKAASWVSNGTEDFVPGARNISVSVVNGDGSTNSNIIIPILSTDNLSDVLKKINEEKKLGITVFHDPQTDKVVVTKNETGSASSLSLDDADTVTFFQQLGFTNMSGPGELTPKTVGTDATFIINGLESSRTTNTFTINNVNYTLKQPTSIGNPVTISISNDTEAILKNIVDFVGKYNDIISKVNGKISESKFRSYQPLTDEQKDSLSDKQIEQWEQKAKSGLIRNDSILSSGLNAMRLGVFNKVEGIAGFSQLAEIGITTSRNYLENGKLLIDETKLRSAINSDPDAIYQMFNNAGTTYETTGIAKRLRDSIKQTITKVEEKAGNPLRTNSQFSIGRTLTTIDSQINRFEDRLTTVEDRYWRQFTAMEKAVQRSNQQSAFLLNAFNSGV
ncbi:flagellar hook-associated protein 2 [Bacillus pinisoli]|uniref:flagellar hook-associated protein 2 n=1 Tax=Bacillus pinisoli TaxID=2901866 RepID=UPI002343040A|nr:flagellar hook-associated protein 2 [Bacillus pinisoli]